ncbi:DEAD/DEAH box helicase [Phocaeicola sp.]
MNNTLFSDQPKIDLVAIQKERLLKELAWNITPVEATTYTYSHIARIIGIPATKVKLYLKELEEEKKLLITTNKYGTSKYYRLPTDLHLKLLTEIKLDPKEYKIRDLYSAWSQQGWHNAIRKYIQQGDTSEIRFPFHTDDMNINTLLAKMPSSPEWLPFFRLLPLELVRSLFYVNSYQWIVHLQTPDMECLNKGYLENPKVPEAIRQEFEAEYKFVQYILTGRINEIPQICQPDTAMHQRMHALYLQYQGRIPEAIKLYQQSLKEYKEVVFNNPIYDTYYIWALANDDSAASKKKLAALRKRKEYTNYPYLIPARLLLWHVLNEKTNIIIEEIQRYGNSLPALPRLLCQLIIRHFHLADQMIINDSEVNEIIGKDELKLLQLEFSQDFMPFIARAEELHEQTGLSPLFPPYRQVEEWERIINMLMEKTKTENISKASPPAEKKQSQSRIIYYVNSFGQITPRLQKSKDGVTWSKGRNIALATFQIGIPEMNDTDRLLSTHVKCYTSGWNYSETWELQGAQAMAELAGYPLVFSESNPNVAVVITKEEPQITVTKTAKGFRIENNIGRKINANTILQQENDFLFHVIRLTTAQRELMNALSEVENFPKQAESRLSVLLPQLSQVITVHSDLVQSKNLLKQVDADALITVQLQPLGEGIKAEMFVKPFVDQPPYCKAGKGNTSVIGTINGERVQAIRNFKKETEHQKQVLEWLQPVNEEMQEPDGDTFFFDNAYLCLDLLDILRAHIDTVRIEWPQGMKMDIKGAADFKNLSLSVKGTGQWFEVEGELKVDTGSLIKIADLLQKVRESKGRFIALGENEFIALSDKLRKQLQAMDVLLTKEKGKLKLSSLTADTLLDVEKQGAKLKKNTAFNDLMKRIEAAEKETFNVPKQLKAELRNYQIDGFRWMSRLACWGAGACLADDMGLGKTLQTIAVMLARGKQGPSLVVAPASVVLNWKSELERFAPPLTPLVMNENGCDRKALIDNASNYDVVLTTYGLLINEAECLAAKAWNVIALDEAHTIKNKETKMSKAAMNLNGSFRLLLTGTPLQNHLSEIWNLFQFANPGLLGSFNQFTEKFIYPIEKEGDKSRQRQLKRLIQPFILRRTKTDVLDELPEKTEITFHVELGEEERALYENLRREAINNLEEGSATAIQTLAEITKLRQAACHPSLVNPELKLPSAKTAAFMKLVEELMNNNHRALVFSQFTSHLHLVRQELDAAGIDYLYLDGSTSIPERNNLVKAFQTGEQPLFLISLKAGGLGLNLTAADFVLHLDPWWNPSVEDQASDRAYRIGQTRPVTVYRLIATQTIEEKIIRLHQTKKSLADSLLDGSDLAHKLTKEEMLELLKEKI